MLKQEMLQDMKALAGFPLYVALIVLSASIGDQVLALRLVFIFLVTQGVIVLIRSLIFRKRPDNEKYHDFISKLDAASFPSMHSARAGSLAVVLGFKFPFAVPVLLFGACALGVAITRVVQKRHYVSDVVVGLLIGASLGFLGVKLVA